LAAGAAGLLAALSVAAGPAGSAGATGAGRGSPGSAAQADPGPGSAADRAGPPDVLPAGGRWTVTLVTGEVVELGADGEGRVTARVTEHEGPYRSLREPGGDLYVIPLDVTPLLDGTLDRELFNVTGLVRQNYHDDARADVPLIVERAGGTDVTARVASADERPLPSIGAVAVEVPKSDTRPAEDLIDELAAAGGAAERSRRTGVTRVWLDRQVRLSGATTPAPAPARAPAAPVVPAQAPPLDANLTQVGADDAWAAGYTGEGVTVAVLDTGVDATHPDLAGQVDAQENFGAAEDAVDHHGHGTHVASLAAGTGAASGGARSGVAPDARLISGKVVDDFGFGQESEAIAGMEWAAPQADVVNMSLGYGGGGDGSDPISMALDTLSEQHGTLFVVAAGNSGPGSRSVEFPGVADRALTVGAVGFDDVLADFSSRGPTPGTAELKPEVVAPGVDIVAARAAGTTMGPPAGEQYVTASGTSMAAPHVAGAAALMAGRHPGWDADEIKPAVVASADALDDDAFDVGAGRIDIGAGVAATVRPVRDAVEVALAHPRTEAHSETLSWVNDGTEPVTLAVEAAVVDREGAAIDGVTVEPAELTIAPGATGDATLTIDAPSLDAALYSGVVTATPTDSAGGDAAAPVRTPVGIQALAETFDLTIEVTPPVGADPEAAYALATIVNLDDYGVFAEFWVVSGSLTIPVPAGRYAVIGDVYTGDQDQDVVAQVGDPEAEITGPTTVEFDGAAAVPFHPTAEGVDTAPPMYSSSALFVTPAAGTEGYSLVTESYAWHPSPPVHLTPMEGDPEEFAASQTYRLQAAHLTVEAGGEALPVVDPRSELLPAEGEHTYPMVDAGDGADLSAGRDAMVLVDIPADAPGRADVTRRAADAGVAVLVFVDESRTHLTLGTVGSIFDPWGELPVLTAGREGTAGLRAAAAAGDEATVTVAGSPYVYDVVEPEASRVDPEPVLDGDEQAEMATVTERFYRDPDGIGVTMDRRYAELNLMNLDSSGPLPRRRTAHVTAGVPWLGLALGPSVFLDPFGSGDRFEGLGAVSFDEIRTYEPGSEHRVEYGSRPQWPGPVGDIPWTGSGCQPTPAARTAERLEVWLSILQDRLDGSTCGDVLAGSLTLERDGVPIPEVEEPLPMTNYGLFPVPAEAGDYRLTFAQDEAIAPYPHRSATTWTFRSGAPSGDEPGLIPLLVVGYDLPLDVRNRPTDDTAELTVRQMTGAEQSRVRRVRVWTSTDDGTTWRTARVDPGRNGRYELRLPRAPEGTGVSLRVSASDAAGATIEQTLYDAYMA
jgi:subtilisin family serine protease